MFYGHVYSTIQNKHIKHIKHTHENRKETFVLQKTHICLTHNSTTRHTKRDLAKIMTTHHITKLWDIQTKVVYHFME